ncbi:MAG: NPCBM/NEW2 domain-containing protein [bacterium]|nr:NPCBM/NEW2 domain-containing protein [bacterium]
MVKNRSKKSKSQKLLNILPNKLFSLKHALIFSLLFAVIGVYFLFRAFASPGTLAPLGTYTWWYWGDYPAATHTSLEASTTIETDPTKDIYKIGYYWANQFWGAGDGGYMGIQTNGEAGTFRGKVALFALWGGITAEGQQPGWCTVQGSNFDGDATASGASCRIPLDWRAGDKYKMRVYTTADDSTGRTWVAVIRNETTGVEQQVGKIKTTKRGLLQGAMVNWTEFYSPGRAECDSAYSKVVFHTPKLENGQIPTRHNNNFGTSRGCSDSAITDVSGGVRHEQSINQAGRTALPSLPTGGVYISDLNWLSATTGYGSIRKDLSASGSPLRINGVTYAKGIGTHAESVITYDLAGKYTKFVSNVGINTLASGTVTYEVWADGVKLFGSSILDSLSRASSIIVDVTGKSQLRLVVTAAGDGITADAADWADARLFPVVTTTPSDTSAPTVSLTSPSNGVTVSGTVSLSASANDNIGVTRVNFYANGTLLGSDTSAPYSYSWNTASTANGSYTLSARAFDAANNSGVSNSVSLSVNNQASTTSVTRTFNGSLDNYGSTSHALPITKTGAVSYVLEGRNFSVEVYGPDGNRISTNGNFTANTIGTYSFRVRYASKKPTRSYLLTIKYPG